MSNKSVDKVELSKKKTIVNGESTKVVLTHRLHGRRQIFTNETEITSSNVLKVLNDALVAHQQNRSEIDYLYNYLRGKQPVIDRVKEVRPEICNRIVVNRANEIVTFKTANFIGEPLQYVSRGTNKNVPEQIEQLNTFMISEGKQSKDMRLAYWMFTCGVGYRLVLKDKMDDFMEEEIFDEAPFEIYTLDPRNTFIVRCNDVTKKVLMGVTYVHVGDGIIEYTVYTKNEMFRIRGSILQVGDIVDHRRYNFGLVPIVEYPCNPLRMGAFEVVLDLLDAINLTESNRLDGVEQFVQALMVFENADISKEQFLELRDLGAIKLPSIDGRPSKVYYLNEQLDQSQTQTLIDDMWQCVREICGIPSQGNANTSDSSNNGAVIMKNGWQNAEARAKETEGMWKESETDFLKIILKICFEADALNLRVSDIEQKFCRRSYEDLMTKVQAFVQLNAANCPPIQAYTVSNLVLDPESAAIEYESYNQQKEEEMNERLKKAVSRDALVPSNSKDTETGNNNEKVISNDK